jgi:Double zinc ribbon
MKCPRCQHQNETGAKFCEECAAALTQTCGNCGRQLSPTAKFCPECAHPARVPLESPTARRFTSPETYTPKHLAEKILTSQRARLLTAAFDTHMDGPPDQLMLGRSFHGLSSERCRWS